MLKRSLARNNAFLLLFECSFFPETDREEQLDLARENNGIEADEFVRDLYFGVSDRVEELDADLAPFCRKRTLSRLSRALLTALRMAVYELKYTDTAPAVVINESVELMKTYDSPEAASYGNGVLASYVRKD